MISLPGLDPQQLLIHVVRPVLSALALPGGVLAEQLIMGTAAQESMGFRYLHQLGKGPALSLWQIEPTTAMDTLQRLPIHVLDRMSMYQVLIQSRIIDQLPGNLYLGAAMCRLVYYMKPFSSWNLPSYVNGKLRSNPVVWCAGIWKRWYNTPLGAGTEEEFISNWKKYKLDDLW